MQGVHLKELAVSSIGAIGKCGCISLMSCHVFDSAHFSLANAVEENIVPYFPRIMNALKVMENVTTC